MADRFEAGKVYDAVYSHGVTKEPRKLTVTRRTEKSVWLKDGDWDEYRVAIKKTVRAGIEFCLPYGPTQARLYPA